MKTLVLAIVVAVVTLQVHAKHIEQLNCSDNYFFQQFGICLQSNDDVVYGPSVKDSVIPSGVKDAPDTNVVQSNCSGNTYATNGNTCGQLNSNAKA